MRSAAKMAALEDRDDDEIARGERRFRAPSSHLPAIASALNSVRMVEPPPAPRPFLLGLGETHRDAPDIARRRGDLPQERRALAAPWLLLADLGGPFGNFLPPASRSAMTTVGTATGLEVRSSTTPPTRLRAPSLVQP